MKNTIRKIIDLILLAIYNWELVDKAIFGRKLIWEDPLSKLKISWFIELKKSGKWDYSPTLNILMFSPLLFLMYGLLPNFFKKHSFLKGAIIAFIASAIVEGIQYYTKLGTVQISDLVYNTLSGILGVAAYRLWDAIIEHKNIKSI